MSRRKKEPLRGLVDQEREYLERLKRSRSAPLEQVIRAKILLAVAEGMSYGAAAQTVGRKSGDAVAHLVHRFNHEGIGALESRHGGGPAIVYREAERARIVEEARRPPDLAQDGTAQWTLSTLQKALRTAPNGFPTISTWTIFHALHEAGWSCQQEGSWCETGQVERKRQGQVVTVVDPETAAKKLD